MTMESLKRGDWVQILEEKGIRPDCIGKKAVVQQTFCQQGVPALALYVFSVGTLIVSLNQVKRIQGGIIGGERS